jgi:hypothetical protein
MGQAKRRRTLDPDNYGQPDIWTARLLDDKGLIADIPYTVPRHRGIAGGSVAIILMSALIEPSPDTARRLRGAMGDDGAAQILALAEELPEHFWAEIWSGDGGEMVGAAFSSRLALLLSGHPTEGVEGVHPSTVEKSAGVRR